MNVLNAAGREAAAVIRKSLNADRCATSSSTHPLLTVSRNDPQRDGVPSLLNEVDDVRVGLIGDGAPVHGQDAVSHFQLPAAVGWAPFDDAPYFVGHGHTCIASYGQHVDMTCWDV